MRIAEYIVACSIVNGLIINFILAKFEVITAVLLKVECFWNVTLCWWTIVLKDSASCIPRKVDFLTLKMRALLSPETSRTVQPSTPHNTQKTGVFDLIHLGNHTISHTWLCRLVLNILRISESILRLIDRISLYGRSVIGGRRHIFLRFESPTDHYLTSVCWMSVLELRNLTRLNVTG